MKITKYAFIALVSWFVSFNCASALEIFHEDDKVLMGLNIPETIESFEDIYKNLDNVNWGGKNLNIAIESLENIHTNAHIAATDNRIVLVWGDDIIANYPRPTSRDWESFAEITTALIVKLREQIPAFAQMSQGETYQVVVDALMKGLDENGKYIHPTQSIIDETGKILTSVGLDGVVDSRGNFRVHSIYKDSPADIAGIKAGDLITVINGEKVSDLGNVKNIFSGFNSGTLKLTLLTPDGKKNAVLRRATVVLADADIVYRKSDDGEYNLLEIIVHKVSENSVDIVNEALLKYEGSVSGIVLDLRAATGDNETALAKMAGLFLGKVPVLRIVETDKAETEVFPGGDRITDKNVVVIVSNTTSGTAEILAAAFYENKGGVLIGTPTAGNPRIATTINLKNGGTLELLNKSIKTGTGLDIDERGIFPLVCLSNIRSKQEQGAFFLNIINDDFNATDYNMTSELSPQQIRQGCPVITNGADEDAAALAVSVKILGDEKAYNKLKAK